MSIKATRNILGHDNISEIITLIIKLRRGKFEVLGFSGDKVVFDVHIPWYIFGLASFISVKKVKYSIRRESTKNAYKYFFKQLTGIPERDIELSDGYIIWGLLEDKLRNCKPKL